MIPASEWLWTRVTTPPSDSTVLSSEMRSGFLCLLAMFCALAGQAAADSVTFTKDIAPIVFEKCATCHRPGQSGPFGLLTYAEVKKRAREVAEVTLKRLMPPWLPDCQPGEFLGDRRLTDRQIETFQEWVKQGAPEGGSSVPMYPDVSEPNS